MEYDVLVARILLVDSPQVLGQYILENNLFVLSDSAARIPNLQQDPVLHAIDELVTRLLTSPTAPGDPMTDPTAYFRIVVIGPIPYRGHLFGIEPYYEPYANWQV